MANFNNNFPEIPEDKFKLVKRGEIHDQKLDTKPIGYFKDAMMRFSKNKGSVVAGCILVAMILFAIVVPMLSPYTVSFRDPYYAKALPKVEAFAGSGFWDGTRVETMNQRGYDYYNAIGTESGIPAITDIISAEKLPGKSSKTYSVRVDSYTRLGYIFVNMTKEEYDKLQAYQNETGIQVIYPAIDPKKSVDPKDANFWFEADMKGDAQLDKNGNYKPVYLTDTNDDYNSLRIAGDDGSYSYALVNQTGYKVRVLYYNYYVYNNNMEPCFAFGANNYGQDILVCLASGARLSFLLAIFVSALNLTIGAVYGAIEGYYGGAIDLVLERISDVLNGVPFIVVVTLFQMHLASKVGALPSLLFAFVLTGWIGMASRVRMQFYRFKGQEYVLAARTLGAKDSRLIVRHIFPNSLGTIITGSILVIPSVIFSESTLTYLGIVNLETSGMTSIGTLLAGGESSLSTFPHIIAFPAIFISLLMICFNLFGNGLRDAFNPSLRGSED